MEGEESNTPPPPNNRDGFEFGPFSPSQARGPIRGINSLLAVAVNTNEAQGQALEKALQTIQQLSEAFQSLNEDVRLSNERIRRLERHQITTHAHTMERINNLERLVGRLGPSSHQYMPTSRCMDVAESVPDPKGKRPAIPLYTPQHVEDESAGGSPLVVRTKREAYTIFNNLLGMGMTLPLPRKPQESGMSSNPNYCPYHRQLGHTLLECYNFKKVMQHEMFRKRVQTMLSILQGTQGTPKNTRHPPSKKRHSCNVIRLGSDSEDEGCLHFPDGDTTKQNIAEQVCNMNLRTGKNVPSRQPPNQKDKAKEKAIETEEVMITVPPKKVAKERTDYNVLAHLKKIPALLTVYDALMLSPNMRDILVQALLNPEDYQAFFAEEAMKETLYAESSAGVFFTDEDLLLGTTEHNRPLYVTGSSQGVDIRRILIDPGSSINIITLRTLRVLELDVVHLSTEKITIQGFNQNSQKALGSIVLPVQVGSLISNIKFHVLNADTSYKALLGRPWIHENGIVPSTLHQCMKYKGAEGEARIEGDIQPFTVNEITRYDDARYFVEEPKRRLKTKITSRIPHLGSDSEGEEELKESGDEKQCCRMQDSSSSTLQIPEEENSISVIPTPEGCSKPLHEAEVATISHLDTFYVPPQRPGHKAQTPMS
jgi:hypothetical protein